MCHLSIKFCENWLSIFCVILLLTNKQTSANKKHNLLDGDNKAHKAASVIRISGIQISITTMKWLNCRVCSNINKAELLRFEKSAPFLSHVRRYGPKSITPVAPSTAGVLTINMFLSFCKCRRPWKFRTNLSTNFCYHVHNQHKQINLSAIIIIVC